jgi:hypothetical protein
VNSSDNDSQDGIESTISFANLGLIYISITPKSGVKGKCKALWGICRQAEAQVRVRVVGAPELCYLFDNPVALTCTSVHPCPPSMSTMSTLATGCISWLIESCFCLLRSTWILAIKFEVLRREECEMYRTDICIHGGRFQYYLQQSLGCPRPTQHVPVPPMATHHPSSPSLPPARPPSCPP